MTTTRFRLDVTGSSREDLRGVFESHLTDYSQSEKEDNDLNTTYYFSKDGLNKWELKPNGALFGQQPSNKNGGGYHTGGIHYKNMIISPPLTLVGVESISEITDLLESESTAITNKTCHFSLTLDTVNLTEQQFFNIILEVAYCESYFKKLSFLKNDFSVLGLELLEKINTAKDIQQLKDYLITKESGLYYKDNQLIFDYIRPAINLDTALHMQTITVLLLSIIEKAINQKSWLALKQMSEENEKFTFRTYMVEPFS